MKKHLHVVGGKCVLSLFAALLSHFSYSQVGFFNTMEAGVTVAPSNFLGDLGGNPGKGTTFLKDNNFSMTKAFIGAHLTAIPAEWINLRLAINYGTLSGDDAVIKGVGGLEEARKFRNQRFKSKLIEGFLAAEIYPTVFLEDDPSDVYHRLRPYGLIGVGVFNFNPIGTDPATGNRVALKDLSTEGQGFTEYPDRPKYKLTQLNIPMGVGIKYFLSDNVNLSFEIIHRKTFTDYVDDVSTTYIDPALFDKYFGAGSPKADLAKRIADQRANGTTATMAGEKRGTATNNDAYYTAGFKLSFRLGGTGRGSGSSMRCPVMRY